MINLILATDENNCIWNDNKLCWTLKKDLKFFSEKTTWNVVIMWKNTYFSLPEKFRPLPNRINFVVSRTLKENKVKVFSTLPDAISEAKKLKKEIFLIWWRQIYEEWIDFADKIYLTRVFWKFNCNVCLSDEFFQKLASNFKLYQKSKIYEESGLKFVFYEYEKHLNR